MRVTQSPVWVTLIAISCTIVLFGVRRLYERSEDLHGPVRDESQGSRGGWNQDGFTLADGFAVPFAVSYFPMPFRTDDYQERIES